MFFAIRLLCRGGKFATIWIAANRGVRALTNADVKSLDVLNTCEEIMNYIISNSLRPSHRLSLSLSSKLIHGLCLIYKKHVDDVYDDVKKMMIHTPKTLFPAPELEESYDTPQGKPKKRVTKKKREIHSDDPDLAMLTINLDARNVEQLLEQATNRVARHADITLHEIDERQLLMQEQERPDPHMDIGQFEGFPTMDQLRPQDKDASESQAPVTERVPTPAEETVQRPAVDEQVLEAAPPAAAQNVTEEAQEAIARNVNHVFGTILKAGMEGKKPRAKKVNDDIFINIVHRKNVAIDRQEEQGICTPLDSHHDLLEYLYNLDTSKTFFYEDLPIEIPQQRPAQKSPLRVEAVDVARETVSTMREKTKGASSLRSDTAEFLPQGQAGLSQHTVIGQMEFAPVIESTPIVEDQIRIEQLVDSTPIRRMTIETELEKQIRTDLCLNEWRTAYDVENLQQIIQQVISAQLAGEMPLTLEQVAEKPLTKKTVAGAFGRLLTLHALQYVELIAEENSTELSHIDLGTKLKNL